MSTAVVDVDKEKLSKENIFINVKFLETSNNTENILY